MTENWKEKLMDEFCVMFERADREDAPGDEWVSRLEDFISFLLTRQDAELREKFCLPHSMVPYAYLGAWGGTMPVPNMRCTKCLMTAHF